MCTGNKIRKITAFVLALAVAAAPCAYAKGKGYSGKKGGGVAYYVKAKTGDLVEITATDVHPPGSKTMTEIEKEAEEAKDSITNGQAGDPDDAGNEWKRILGLDGTDPQDINGRTALLTPEELQELLNGGAKTPENDGKPRTPAEQDYLDRLKALLEALGNPFDLIPDPGANLPSVPEIPKEGLESMYDDYQVSKNDAYVDATNGDIEKEPASVTEIAASNVSDDETAKDSFSWNWITQVNQHWFAKKKIQFIEYTGTCSACYKRAIGNGMSESDAKEYARYSNSKMCHCGKFIRCDYLSEAYQSKYGTDIRVEQDFSEPEKGYYADSFYMRDTDNSLNGKSKSGESNYSSINHFDQPIPDGGYSSEIVHAPGNGLYDNFTNEKIISVDDASGAGTNRILPGGACYSEKTAKMTLAEVRAAAEKNSKNLPETLKKVGYEDTSRLLLSELSKFDNAENRTIEDLLREAYGDGNTGERIYQVKRADEYVTKEEYIEQYSDSDAGSADVPNPQAGGNVDITGNGAEGATGAGGISNGVTDGTGGTGGTGGDQGNGQTGGDGNGQNPGGGQKPGGTNPNTPAGDENNDNVFDAEDVLIKLFGGAGGMDGVRKNVHYQELLKKFKNEEDLKRFINGLIESGYIEIGKTPSEWSKVLNQEAEEYDRATSENYEVNYYYTSSGEQTVGKEERYNLIIGYKFDLIDENNNKIIDGREWGGGSTYWVAGSAGKYTVKRSAQVWESVTKTVQVTETLRVVDSKGNELYNRSWTDTRVDAYGLKEKDPHWTSEGIRDIVIEVKGGNGQPFATSRVH